MLSNSVIKWPIILITALILFVSSAFAVDEENIDHLVMEKNINVGAVKEQGEAVMPALVKLYNATDDKLKRAKIAWLFYQLNWQSEAAKDALLQDVHTDDHDLRLWVQWALGRVSNDDTIVDVLLDTMQHDSMPLFREKATCALASDQIHLTPQQHYKLLQGLVQGLKDPKIDVRSNVIKALSIQTGQTKDFNPNGSESERAAKIQVWEQWLEEYKNNL